MPPSEIMAPETPAIETAAGAEPGQLWSADLSITPRTRDLVVRATDSAGGSQPKRIDWNMKGYLFNAWHRTPVAIDA